MCFLYIIIITNPSTPLTPVFYKVFPGEMIIRKDMKKGGEVGFRGCV